MKTVLVDPTILAPGSDSDVLIDPETDVLNDDDDQDPVVFVENEPVIIRFVDNQFITSGFVRKLHEDELGYLVQLSVDWEGSYLPNE